MIDRYEREWCCRGSRESRRSGWPDWRKLQCRVDCSSRKLKQYQATDSRASIQPSLDLCTHCQRYARLQQHGRPHIPSLHAHAQSWQCLALRPSSWKPRTLALAAGEELAILLLLHASRSAPEQVQAQSLRASISSIIQGCSEPLPSATLPSPEAAVAASACSAFTELLAAIAASLRQTLKLEHTSIRAFCPVLPDLPEL